MAVLIFLGAGASKPFDIPTMTEMVTRFENDLKIKHPEEYAFYSEIRKILLGANYKESEIDIESIFSVIEGITSDIKLKDLGHFAVYYMQRNSIIEQPFSEEDKTHAKILKKELEDFIKKECCFNGLPEKWKEICNRSWKPFFSNLKISERRSNNLELDWRAYTTNYDRIFEDYWLDIHRLSDHFVMEGSKREYFDQSVDPQIPSLVKLHGSIDWKRLNNKRIMRLQPHEFTTQETEGEVMLFPLQQKDLYLNPWITMVQHFKKGLAGCEKWYVIGYAFNDKFTLEIFIEALKSRGELIIINPHAKIIKETKFPQDLHHKIIALPIRFGDKYFEKDFEDFSINSRTIALQIETKIESLDVVINDIIDKLDESIDGVQFATYVNGSGVTTLEFRSDEGKTEKFYAKFRLKNHKPLTKDLMIKTKSYPDNELNIQISNQGRSIFFDSSPAGKFEQSSGEFVREYVIDSALLYPDSN